MKLAFNRPECGKRTLTQRFGLLSLLLIRELSYYLVTQYCCLVLSIVITSFPTSGTLLLRFLFFQYPVAYWFFIIRFVRPISSPQSYSHIANGSFCHSCICLITSLVITHRARSEFVSVKMMIFFSIAFPFYLVFAAIIGLYGHARQVSKYSSWNPTART
jgi:hypothetical protein